MAEIISYSHLVDMLAKHVENKESGTLYIRSQCNHAISFALDAGNIYAVYYGPRRGKNALPLITKIKGGSCHFDALKLGVSPQDVPDTSEILALLQEPLEHDDGSSEAAPKANKVVTSEQNDQICYELKELLSEHLGPISDMIFEDAVEDNVDFCKSSEQAQLLIDKLAEDIEDGAESARFRKQANDVITRLMKY